MLRTHSCIYATNTSLEDQFIEVDRKNREGNTALHIAASAPKPSRAIISALLTVPKPLFERVCKSHTFSTAPTLIRRTTQVPLR